MDESVGEGEEVVQECKTIFVLLAAILDLEVEAETQLRPSPHNVSVVPHH